MEGSGAMALSERERRARRREALTRSETDAIAPAAGTAVAATTTKATTTTSTGASSGDGDANQAVARRATRSSSGAATETATASSSLRTKQRGSENKRESPSNTSGVGRRQPVKKQKTAAASTGSAAVTATASTSAVRTYNLRATTARKQAHQQQDGAKAATTVTPAAPLRVRQINFDGSSGGGGADQKQRNGPPAVVPVGVVDLFDERQTVLTRPTCNCPFDRSIQLDTALSFNHIATYGKEQVESLREREIGHWDELSDYFTPQVLLEAQASPASSVVPPYGVGASSGVEEDGASSPESGVVSNASTRSPSTPAAIRGALGRFRFRSQHPHHHHSDPSSDAGELGGNIDLTEPMPRQPLLTPRMRAVLVNWLVEVSLEYKMSDRAVHLAISILDYVLWLGPTKEEMEVYDPEDDDDPNDPEYFLVSRPDFQAVGCACAWIASKFEDKSPPSSDDLTYIADHSFTANKLRSLETRICRDLDFKLNLVTPVQYVNIYLRASHACPSRSCQHDHPVLREVVMYLLELSRLPYDLTVQCPSLVAAAAVYLARATLGIRNTDPDHALHTEGFWTKTLQHYTGYSIDELRDPVLHMYRFQLVAEESDHFQGIYQKYRTAEHQHASIKPARRIEDLGLVRGIKHDDLDLNLMLHEIFHPSMKWW